MFKIFIASTQTKREELILIFGAYDFPGLKTIKLSTAVIINKKMSNALIPTGCLPTLSKTNKFLPGMLIIKTQFPLFNR